jgi:hypothetical protein
MQEGFTTLIDTNLVRDVLIIFVVPLAKQSTSSHTKPRSSAFNRSGKQASKKARDNDNGYA